MMNTEEFVAVEAAVKADNIFGGAILLVWSVSTFYVAPSVPAASLKQRPDALGRPGGEKPPQRAGADAGATSFSETL